MDKDGKYNALYEKHNIGVNKKAGSIILIKFI